MWSSRLFWRLFLAYTALNVTADLALVVIVTRRHEQEAVRQVAQRLCVSAALLRNSLQEGIAEGAAPQLQQRVRRLGEETGARITCVDMDGVVLADSRQAGPLQDRARRTP